MDELSGRLKNYLAVAYELSTSDGARLTDIARRMNVTKSSVSAAMTALAEKRLISRRRYRSIRLTEAGEEIAKRITRKHETVRRFFSEILNLDDEVAAVDANAIKHIISDKAVESMQNSL
jgi:Mn-dependent DtxR family transcriptional regulator